MHPPGLCITSLELAVFTRTMRGKDQVMYHGQPFILEREIPLKNGQSKRVWRCNQWWSGKCRARLFTIDSCVWPLKQEHTHIGVVTRKKRVRRITPKVGQVEIQSPTLQIADMHSLQ